MNSNIYKYIDINSQYRNRSLYPNPTDFVIPVSLGHSNVPNAFQALDPIALGIPYMISTTQAGSTPTQIILNSTSSTIRNFYVDDYLQIGSEYRIILNYDASTKTATVNLPFSVAPLLGTQYYIRRAIPLFSSVLGVGSVQNILNLGPLASSNDEAYTGSYVYFTTGPNTGISMLITKYIGSTKLATLSKSLPNIPVLGDSYDIVAFSKDNFSPLIYSGTTGFNQPVCYSIELLYLLLPNVNIKSGYGGTFDKYPFFYVKLYNEGNNHSTQVLYSNNPNTNSVLFKVPLGLNLRSETFFTLNGSKSIQVVKFKPDESLRFTIMLPDGSPVIFEEEDTKSPLLPNQFLQVSCTFSIRRIDS